MPAKKQKQQKNAFFYFMEDFKAREEKKGKYYKSFAEVAKAAGPEWQKMTPEERRPYELKKEENRRQNKEKKYTALGEDIALVNKQGQEAERMKKEMQQYIEDLVSEGNDFVNQIFYVAHVNFYCYCNTFNRYIPAEIAIVRFNLNDGVKLEDCYNVILDPGKMPIGYYLAAISITEESHQIPLPPHEDDMMNFSERDIKKAFFNMTEFLRKELSPQDRLPPVYVDDNNFELAKDVFKNLHEEYDGDNVYNEISVYSLSYLFYVLRNAARASISPVKAFPFPTIPQAELEKDVYDYVKGISCKFHDITNDAYPHCALSKCIRKVFIICDHTCYDLNITLIPGRHIPINANSEKLKQTQSQDDWVLVKSHNHNRATTSQEEKGRKNGTSAGFAQAVQASSSRDNSMNIPSTSTSNPSTSSHDTSPTLNSACGSSVASGALRKPQTRSMAMNIRPAQPPNLINDFPALGERPVCVGRGRGRMTQQQHAYKS